MKKTLLLLASVSAITLLISAVLYFYIMMLGERSLFLLAKEGGFCQVSQHSTEIEPMTARDCQDGISYASDFLGKEFGLSPKTVQWCMGVDELAQWKIKHGNGLKNVLTDMLYHQCDAAGGELSVDLED